MTTEALKAAAEIMEWLKDSWGAHNARDSDVPYVADAFNAFAARKVAEAVAAERERCAKIAEAWQKANNRRYGDDIGENIAAAIRKTP
jgi:hypothetical protein